MSFILKEKKNLPTLGLILETYEHTRTGAMHYHFVAPNTENVFMVALRTMPHDSTGVAHILEHTALCGSKNFPVRDPFFMMLRRSLQTFMNAFTSSDWTAYPFSTENPEDFDNLLQVYLDAVFFPNLHHLDFLQEGHRLEFEGEKLITKGVVYNEMKGVYGDTNERIFEIQKSFLQPSTTYHHDSGGTPSHILDLSYEAFLAFHKKHYHPTNALFFTFGNIPAHEHQDRFEQLALRHFSDRTEKVLATDEKRFIAPVRIETGYPSTDQENPNQVHILVSWLLPFAHESQNRLEAELVYKYLLDNSASPLRYVLENASWGASPSPLCMLDDSARELRFSAGLITDNVQNTEKTESLIMETLEKIVREGVDPEESLALIDQIEISLREKSSGYPYGLTVILSAIGAATHGGDIAEILDPTEVLDMLREKSHSREYIPDLIKRYFLDNPHRVTLTVKPDFEAGKVEQRIEEEYHEKILARLSEDQKQCIRKDAADLAKRQKNHTQEDILPRLSVSDIPLSVSELQSEKTVSEGVVMYRGATNHLGYARLAFPIHTMDRHDILTLGMVNDLFGELGYGSCDYLAAQKEILKKTGGIGSSFRLGERYGEKGLSGYFTPNVRYLASKKDAAGRLFTDMVKGMRFDEFDHIRDMFQEELLSLRSAFTQNGHRVAMLRSRSGMSLAASLQEELGGIAHMRVLKDFMNQDNQTMGEAFSRVYEKVTSTTPLRVFVESDPHMRFLNDFSGESSMEEHLTIPFAPSVIAEAWITDLAVSYCALSIQTVPQEHHDAPILRILAQFLRDGYLHSAIREQGGAYGAGASYDEASGGFSFYSYRDPRIVETFADFQQSIRWFIDTDHDPLRLEEAKLGVFSGMNTPTSLAQEAIHDMGDMLFGYTREVKNAWRKKLLEVTLDDMKKVAQKYLLDAPVSHRVVITGPQNTKVVSDMSLEIFYL